MRGPTELAHRAQLPKPKSCIDQHLRVARPTCRIAAHISDACRRASGNLRDLLARSRTRRVEQNGAEPACFFGLQRVAEQIAVKRQNGRLAAECAPKMGFSSLN